MMFQIAQNLINFVSELFQNSSVQMVASKLPVVILIVAIVVTIKKIYKNLEPAPERPLTKTMVIKKSEIRSVERQRKPKTKPM